MNRIAITLIIAGSLISAAFAVVTFALSRDYPLIAYVECDPLLESCFVGDGENTPEAYKIIEMKAYKAPSCNGWAGECEPLVCESGDEDCVEILCEDEDCYASR